MTSLAGARLIVITLCVALFSGTAVRAQEKESANGHQREELGINPYTAPSVDEIFQQLDDLKPLPFDLLKRELPQGNQSSREQMGLVFGGLIADGFLIVQSQKTNLVEDLGRVLLRQAKSLGVGDRVIRHSASLTELGKRGDWPAMRRELIATQTDVEQAMKELRDQKLAHLVSLGGWLRGLEITSGAVDSQYTPERAAILWQPDLINYFNDELKTLPPALAHAPLFEKVQAGVGQIRNLLDHAPPDNMSAADVKSLHTQAHELNLAIATPE